MIYVVILAVLFAVVWWGFVWHTLKVNPVPPLAPIDDWRVRESFKTPYPDYQQLGYTALSVSASSAYAVTSTSARPY